MRWVGWGGRSDRWLITCTSKADVTQRLSHCKNRPVYPKTTSLYRVKAPQRQGFSLLAANRSPSKVPDIQEVLNNYLSDG